MGRIEDFVKARKKAFEERSLVDTEGKNEVTEVKKLMDTKVVKKIVAEKPIVGDGEECGGICVEDDRTQYSTVSIF